MAASWLTASRKMWQGGGDIWDGGGGERGGGGGGGGGKIRVVWVGAAGVKIRNL